MNFRTSFKIVVLCVVGTLSAIKTGDNGDDACVGDGGGVLMVSIMWRW